MDLQYAPDVKKKIHTILQHISLPHVNKKRVICMRSFDSKSRARARIWSFPSIWQKALKLPSHYIIEVVSQHYDHLKEDDKTRVIIHELMHIPKTFSGALRPHRGRHVQINRRTVEQVFSMYKKSIK